MLVAILAPEIILTFAIDTYLDARHYLPYMRSFGADGWTITHMQFAGNEGFHDPLTNKRVKNARELAELARIGRVREPPILAEELYSRGKSDGFIKAIALVQILWFGLQTIFRAASPAYTTTALEISTVAFVFCSLMTYAFYWNLPQDIEYPVPLDIEDEPSTTTQNRSRAMKDRADLAQSIVIALLCALFGALHCLAWNLPFPTPQERLAWRVCAVATTVLGPLFILGIYSKDERKPLDVMILRQLGKLFKRYNDFVLLFSFCYAVARITNIVLAFTALRALPDNVYQTTNWNNYLPHVGT